MNTAEALETITDRGQFELLVTSVLRKSNKDYTHILHTGVNAAGVPIKSPVDGFCRIPNSTPPHFLIVQVTTTEKRNLKGKWLRNRSTTSKGKSTSASEDGDLIKASREVQEIKKEFPNAKFTVILVSNQHLDLSLIKEVNTKAEEFNVVCDIWDQSRLVDYLDNEPEGHWLRREYLGIEAEMLSESLLYSLCQQSLANYEKELMIADPNNCISREIEYNIQEGIYSNNFAIHFLVGESGFGKSIAAYRTLKKHLKQSRYGIWIPAELLSNSTSLTNILDKILHDLHPNLLPDAGKAILQFIHEGYQFLIIIDDINRTENPMKFIHKLLTWSNPQKRGTSDLQSSISSFHVVCPIWPHIWGSINIDFTKNSWVNAVFIGPMTSTEGELAVRAALTQAGLEIAKTEANELAKKMGNDPILIGLFSSLLSSTEPLDLNILAEDVFDKFIESSVAGTASASNTSYLSVEYRNGLSLLSYHMLQKRKLYPSWKEIESWLKDDTDKLKALRELIQQNILCKLKDKKQFVFRHDRIQEFLLVESMTTMFNDSYSIENLSKEPFYAEIIGRALMRSPQSEEFLEEMQIQNPLALFETIRYFDTSDSEYFQKILQKIKMWVKNNIETGTLPDSIMNAICWSLIETDSPSVLEITENFPKYPLVYLARLRNGCTKSGIQYCAGKYGFSPKYNDPLRDKIFEMVKSRHREKILKELKLLLKSTTTSTNEQKGALVLSGFLGFTELQDDIATCWNNATDKIQILSEAIWAITQCCDTEPNRLLDPLMEYWDKLSEEKGSNIISPKMHVADNLHFALAHSIQNEVLNYLITQCEVYKSLSWPITYMCDRINTPEAIEFVVKSAANKESKVASTNGYSPWVISLPGHWDDSRIGGHRLSEASLTKLKTLWENSKNDEFIQKQAFRLWLTGIGREQINILRTIPNNSSLFHFALWKRVQLNDHSAVPDLLPLLLTKTHWFNISHHVWCNELMIAAEHHLEIFKDNIPKNFQGGRLDSHYDLSRFLMMIPVKDAEILLIKYWEHLGYSSLFIITALYVGTTKCLELAADIINKCSDKDKLFEHISIHFGFMDSERHKYLTKQHVYNLLPYLNYLCELDLCDIVGVCWRLDMYEWSEKHLKNKLSEKDRKYYYPSDEDLFENLDKFVLDRRGEWRVEYWVEEFERRGDSKERALDVVDRWLESHPTIEHFKIAAACIQAIGTRKDLSRLNKYTIEGPSDEITHIITNTQFSVKRRSLD